MITLQTLTPLDLNRRLIYKPAPNAEHSGAPEYAILIDFDHRFLHIRIVGDASITKARPSECTWPA
jgi:hypothetical protein